jgi:hypothetical protein
VAAVPIRKLKANNSDATKLTKEEILAILFFVFHTLKDDKKKKDMRVAVLSHQTIKDQTNLPCMYLVPSLPQATAWDADESPFTWVSACINQPQYQCVTWRIFKVHITINLSL